MLIFRLFHSIILLQLLLTAASACKVNHKRGLQYGAGALFYQSCYPLHKLYPPASLNPSQLTLKHTMVSPVPGLHNKNLAKITIATSDKADIYYYQACKANSIRCFDKMTRLPETLDHRFQPGNFNLKIRACVWPDRAHVKNDYNKVSPSSSERTYYCGSPLVVDYNHPQAHNNLRPTEQWQKLLELEEKLHNHLYQFTDLLKLYLFRSPTPHPLVAEEFQRILFLREYFHILALSPVYDFAYQNVAQTIKYASKMEEAIMLNCAFAYELRSIRTLYSSASVNQFTHAENFPATRTVENELVDRISVYTLLALGGISSDNAEVLERSLTFEKLHHSIHHKIFHLDLLDKTLDSSEKAAFPPTPSFSSEKTATIYFGVGASHAVNLDKNLSNYFKMQSDLEEEKGLYDLIYLELIEVAKDFHATRESYTSIKHNILTKGHNPPTATFP